MYVTTGRMEERLTGQGRYRYLIGTWLPCLTLAVLAVVALISLTTPATALGLVSSHVAPPRHLLALAGVLVVMAAPVHSALGQLTRPRVRRSATGTLLALFVIIGLALFTRSMWGEPVAHLPGYDTGQYYYLFSAYRSALPDVAYPHLSPYLRTHHPPGLYVLYGTLSLLTDMGPSGFMYLVQFGLTALTAVPVFVLGRRAGGTSAGFLAALLYLTSSVQFLVASKCYLKTTLGQFLLLTLLLPVPTAVRGLIGGTLLLTHRAEFLAAALALGAVAVFDSGARRGHVAALAIAGLLFLVPLHGSFSLVVVRTLGMAYGSSGTFIDIEQASGIGPLLLLLATYSLWSLLRHTPLLAASLVFCLVNTTFELFFYHRFVATLDLTAVIAASVGAALLMREWRGRRGDRAAMAVAAAALLVPATAQLAFVTGEAHTIRFPMETVRAAVWMQEGIPGDAEVVAVSQDATLALYSQRRVLLPGYLWWSRFTAAEWRTILSSGDHDRVVAALAKHPDPLYVFTSHRRHLNRGAFDGPCFTTVFEASGAVVYRREDACREGIPP